MGTEFDENKWRNEFNVNDETISDIINDLQRISSRSGVSLDTLVKILEVAEQKRKNNLIVNHGNNSDAHVKELCELLEKTNDGLSRIAVELRKIRLK